MLLRGVNKAFKLEISGFQWEYNQPVHHILLDYHYRNKYRMESDPVSEEKEGTRKEIIQILSKENERRKEIIPLAIRD